jgi:glycerol uptake facilitator-like aquaporin
MFSKARLLQIMGVLAIIAPAVTDISLALQNHFGRSLVLMLLGQIVDAVGATALALWLRKRE